MRLALLALALAACEGTSGTVSVALTTAPGSTVLDGVQRLRLTLTDPMEVDEATRGSDGGFGLSLSFSADGSQIGALIIEGFDDGDNLVATGASPPFALAPTDARIVVYMAPPLSILPAPNALGPARSGVVGVALPYGALFAGGRDAGGAPAASLAIYNAYDHTISGGMPLPAARAEFALAADLSQAAVFFVGGTGANGPATDVLRFDTTVAPSGAYTALGDEPSLARTGQIAVPIGVDQFLITGTPPAVLAGSTLAARTDLASLPSAGASLTGTDGVRTALFIGPGGIIRYRDDHFDTPSTGALALASVAALPTQGVFVVAGGDTTDALSVDPATGTPTTHAGALSTVRHSPAIAATDRYVVIAGGTDAADAAIPSADILEATTLARVATVPIAPRTGAVAFSLPNGQILIAGGAPATDLVELFTPPPP